ncbi:hypothetical protein VP01_699g8 [Puccinia sorghi]|uniref:RING-type domain-containing protein n=1 Tax=Puccinia sorghi TaxID=27349 RepID=A0A0L6UG25_9BASI|nr:hypothetical protein VP01_699g8 [Puccinia sorghi]
MVACVVSTGAGSLEFNIRPISIPRRPRAPVRRQIMMEEYFISCWKALAFLKGKWTTQGMSGRQGRTAKGGGHTCMICGKEYRPASPGTQAELVAILPACRHHFHADCLQDKLRLQEANPARPRFTSLDCFPIDCPASNITCKKKSLLYNRNQPRWHASRDAFLDSIDFCFKHIKESLLTLSDRKTYHRLARRTRAFYRKSHFNRSQYSSKEVSSILKLNWDIGYMECYGYLLHEKQQQSDWQCEIIITQ